MQYNPYDVNNRRDADEAAMERWRLDRDGYIARPLSRPLPDYTQPKEQNDNEKEKD